MKPVIILLILLALTGCCAVDECPAAREGFVIYQPVIDALEHYKSDNNVYPESLESLVPEYLPAIPHPASENASGPEYTSDGSSFKLSFQYTGPGMNGCSYLSVEKKWGCTGFY